MDDIWVAEIYFNPENKEHPYTYHYDTLSHICEMNLKNLIMGRKTPPYQIIGFGTREIANKCLDIFRAKVDSNGGHGEM